jgi:DNA-binding beta-propeller fold protein YncE
MGAQPGDRAAHFYILDTQTDALDLFTTFTANDLHGFDVSPNGKWAFAAERGSDLLRRIDLTDANATPAAIPLNPDPSLFGATRPDKVAVRGNIVYVPLRANGHVALVNGTQGTVQYIELVPPSANALHGVTVRQ